MTFKLLVVDDEAIMRNGIANFIDWDSLDCQVAGTAGNGIPVLLAGDNTRGWECSSPLHLPMRQRRWLPTQIRIWRCTSSFAHSFCAEGKGGIPIVYLPVSARFPV